MRKIKYFNKCILLYSILFCLIILPLVYADYTKINTTGLTFTASTTYQAYTASKAFDADLSTYWWSDNAATNEWLKIDLGAGNEKQVTQTRIYHDDSTSITGKIQGSNDNNAWTDINSFTHGLNLVWYNDTFSNSNNYRYYRINISSESPIGNWIQIMEWELYTGSAEGGSSSVPEFSDYAMIFILVIGIGGFLVVKRSEN